MRRFLKILRVTAAVLLVMILCGNLWLLGGRLIGKQSLPRLFGHSFAIVLSGSMEPAFSPGDLLIFREQERYEPGDVIIFQQGGALVTHRIVERAEDGFITQGDANNAADPEPAAFSQVEGRMVWVLPAVGNVLLFLRSPLGILLLVAAGLLMVELPHIARALQRRKEGGQG